MYCVSPGHRAVYVGVHVPLGRESRKRHRHRGHKHHRKKKEKDDEGKDGRESPTGMSYFLPAYLLHIVAQHKGLVVPTLTNQHFSFPLLQMNPQIYPHQTSLPQTFQIILKYPQKSCKILDCI